MGTSTTEKGVLKLVHPGRHVEIHKQPITAAEVMSKNPRHSVTRPDVFKNPWIVVRPESVLVPGEVFYIVPNRTIHMLLKSKGQPFEDDQKVSLSKRNLPQNSCAGMTTKHQSRDQNVPHQHEENGQKKGTSHSYKKSPVNSSVNGKYCNRAVFPESQNVDKKIKSCMRKKENVRKSRNLRVRFDLSTTVTNEIEHNVMKRKGFVESLLCDKFSIDFSSDH